MSRAHNEMLPIIFCMAALITAHGYSLKGLGMQLVARLGFSPSQAALTHVLLFLLLASVQCHVGRGLVVPVVSAISWLGRSYQRPNLAPGR